MICSETLQESIVRSGMAWFSTTRSGERTWLRFCIVNLTAREHNVDSVAREVHSIAMQKATGRQ